jgi:hypothetical protein
MERDKMAKEKSEDKIKWCNRCNAIEVDESEDKDGVCINCRILEDMKQEIEEIQSIDLQLKPLHDKYFGAFSDMESYFSKEGKKARLQFLKESKQPLKRQKELLKCVYKNARILKEINS